MTTEDDFFNGFEPKALKVDPIGPTAELRAIITQQAATISQLREALKKSSEQHHTWCPFIADWPRGSKPCICPKSVADAALASIPKDTK